MDPLHSSVFFPILLPTFHPSCSFMLFSYISLISLTILAVFLFHLSPSLFPFSLCVPTSTLHYSHTSSSVPSPSHPPFHPCLLLLFVSQQKFPDDGLANVVRNVFDFDSYNKDMQEVLIEVLHKHGIPIGAKPSSVKLAKE